MGKYKKHIIVKEENSAWYNSDGNIICVEINGVWTPLPEYEYDEVDYIQILKQKYGS